MGANEKAASMERLKVVFLVTRYPTSQRPVEAVFIREQARAAQIHHDVSVLHCAGGRSDLAGLWRGEQEADETLTGGLPTYRVWERRCRVRSLSYLIRLWSVPRMLSRIAGGRFRPDVVHAHLHTAGLLACLIGRWLGVRVVVSEHSSAFHGRTLSPLEEFYAKLAFRWANLVLPVSRALQGAIEGCGISARYRVVPNAVDVHLFYPDGRPRLPGQPRRMLFVGLLDDADKKGVSYLLHALARVKVQRDDWHLDIVGDGPGRNGYESLAADLGLQDKVTFVGLRAKPEVAEHMRRSDFLVLPSRYETFGAVLIEALASGVPVIATSSGGPVEIVSDQVGLLVPPQDIDALARAICRMLDHCTDYPSSSLARYAQERFSHEAVGLLLDRVYRQVRKA